MRLFHGSSVAVRLPRVDMGRSKVDFGPGFYLTSVCQQAESWARTIAGRKRGGTPVLNVYEFDETEMRAQGFRHRVFDTYSIEWLEYVVDSRQGGNIHADYDVVEGGVANDNVIDTVEDYEKGIITAEQALGQLTYKKVNHQICLLNQLVVDACLRFVDSRILPLEGTL